MISSKTPSEARNTFSADLLSQVEYLDGQNIGKISVLVARYKNYFSDIDSEFYRKLPATDRPNFIAWFLKRWGGISIVSASSLQSYDAAVKRFSSEPYEEVTIDGESYKKVNFLSQGYDFDLVQYGWTLGIHDIFYNQYEHGSVSCDPGDVIIDAGAFIGDTAVLFNYQTRGDCEIHCFELLDENIRLMHENAKINNLSGEKLKINKVALADKSGEILKIKTSAVQGATKVVKHSEAGDFEEIPTISIDDYVASNNLEKIDFIKMDIEGAEIPALLGARETIARFKPKLAICVYHLWDDPVTIPSLINKICKDYRFYFKWVHLRTGWEAVLLADARPPAPNFLSDKEEEVRAPDNFETLESSIIHLLNEYSKREKKVESLWVTIKRDPKLKGFKKLVKKLLGR